MLGLFGLMNGRKVTYPAEKANSLVEMIWLFYFLLGYMVYSFDLTLINIFHVFSIWPIMSANIIILLIHLYYILNVFHSVSLYLLHEHIVCETLDKRIKATQTVDPNKPNLMTPLQVLSYVRGILSGMELVHSYGVREANPSNFLNLKAGSSLSESILFRLLK